MENRANMMQRSAAMDELYKQLVEKLDFPLPPAELESTIRTAVERRIEGEKQGGKVSEEEVAAKVPQFEAEAREHVEKDMRFAKFLSRVAKAEKLEVSQQDLGNFFMQYAMQNNTDVQELINNCIKNRSTMYRINQELLSRKALNLICDSSVAADA
jgi:trigger factor